MKAVLLCAGYATRLYPLTKDKPKPLLPIAGDKSMLEWLLDHLSKVPKVDAVYLVTNDKFAGHFESWAKDKKFPWPLVTVNDKTTSNETRLGAIGDLNYVLTTQKIGAEDLIVLAGDNYFDFDLPFFVAQAEKKRPHGSIAVYDVGDRELAKQYGLVSRAADGKILEFFEKPKDPPTTLASCGIYWLPKETRVLLDRYIAGGHNADQPGHYMSWLAQTDGLYAVPLQGVWLDIGDLQSYEKAKGLVLAPLKNPERKN